MDICILSKNRKKLEEYENYLRGLKINLKPYPNNIEINEIQTDDVNLLIRDKLMKAFKLTKLPVLVEHTGLDLEVLNGFPGGLTQPFWDKLQKEKFCEFFGGTTLTAKTVIGFCDGKKMYYFNGEIIGTVALEPKGNDSFQWDCIFIPNGYSETFAELESKKLEISMRKKAFDKLKEFLEENYV